MEKIQRIKVQVSANDISFSFDNISVICESTSLFSLIAKGKKDCEGDSKNITVADPFHCHRKSQYYR